MVMSTFVYVLYIKTKIVYGNKAQLSDTSKFHVGSKLET